MLYFGCAILRHENGLFNRTQDMEATMERLLDQQSQVAARQLCVDLRRITTRFTEERTRLRKSIERLLNQILLLVILSRGPA